MAIPASFTQELLARVDLIDVIGPHVQLKKSGANFMGLCPFHGEKSPSFSVSPSKQFFHCFGCGKSGDAIAFLMDHLGMGFRESVEDLAQRYGMPVPDDAATPQDRARAVQQRDHQRSLAEVLETACKAFQSHLKGATNAVAYLKGRGVSGATAHRFRLGYAPPGWRTLAGVFPSYSDPRLVESGLVIVQQEDGADERRYDRFRDRVMFPIRNLQGECIAFGGRVLNDEKPKYLNSPETPLFVKGRELYGLYEARQALREKGFALVTEGYMDVVALAQLGFPNAVATLGTACTPDHVQKLFRFTDSVIFSFDGDAAGKRAARKALEASLPWASDERSIKFLFLPEEHDPDSYIREHGEAAFANKIAQALPLSRFMLEVAKESSDLSTAEGRAQAASRARPLWLKMPEGVLKQQLLGEFAELSQLTSREILNLWRPPAASDNRDLSGSGASRKNMGAIARLRGDPPAAPTNSPGRSPQTARTNITLSGMDQVVVSVLKDNAALGSLSAEEQSVLTALPPPHGSLYAWLESQWQEHGQQPWAALREGLRGHPLENWVVSLWASRESETTDLPETDHDPLQALVRRLLIKRLKSQETEAIADAEHHPEALERYKKLYARRRQLEQLPQPEASAK